MFNQNFLFHSNDNKERGKYNKMKCKIISLEIGCQNVYNENN